MDIILTFPDGKSVQTASGCQVKDMFSYFNPSNDQIVAVRINNEICSLSQKVEVNADLEPVYLASREGSSIYRRTLCFVLAAAAHKLFPKVRLLVGHSLGYGYYYTFDSDTPITEENLKLLKDEVKSMIIADKQILQQLISYKEALKLFTDLNLIETRKQLKYVAKPQYIVNKCGDFADLYFAPLLESTGALSVFDILAYKEGFLLRFPISTEPNKLSPFVDNPMLFNIYKQYKSWGRMLGVTSVASLNEMANNRKVRDFIDISETLQNKCLASIADQIKERGKIKVVLIAGPSSSGKTTSSKKLATQLRVLGYKPHVLSLDSYYLGRDFTPKDENGDYDYECLEALDVAQLNQNLLDLFAGKEVKIPSYDFKIGKQFYTGETLSLGKEDILVLEGIHGLNDKLTPLISPENKFKIYISALTQLNLDDHNRIATSDNRLIRRIVRDAQFRGKSAADTIKMWPNVQKGERLHIFPFQNNADAVFNSALDYELSVLRVFAGPLLRCVTPLDREYAEASRLISFLSNFYTISAAYVPGKSIIREFIGGSEYKY